MTVDVGRAKQQGEEVVDFGGVSGVEFLGRAFFHDEYLTVVDRSGFEVERHVGVKVASQEDAVSVVAMAVTVCLSPDSGAVNLDRHLRVFHKMWG